MNFLATALASSGNSTSTLAEVEPGVLGFLVVAALGVICVFLFRNMNKQFKKLGPPPEEKGADVSVKAEQPVRTGDQKQDVIAEGAAKRK